MLSLIAILYILRTLSTKSFVRKNIQLLSPYSDSLSLAFKNRKIIVDEHKNRARIMINPLPNNKYEVLVDGIQVCSSIDHDKVIPCSDKGIFNDPTWSIRNEGDYLEILLKSRYLVAKKDHCWTLASNNKDIILKKCKKKNSQRFKFLNFDAEGDREMVNMFSPTPEIDASVSTEKEDDANNVQPFYSDGNKDVFAVVECNRSGSKLYPSLPPVDNSTCNFPPKTTTRVIPQKPNNPTTQQIYPQTYPVETVFATAPDNQSQNTSCALPKKNYNTTQVNPVTYPTIPNAPPSYNNNVLIQDTTCALPQRNSNITPASEKYVAAPNVQTQSTTCALPQRNSNITPALEKLVTTPTVQPQNTTCALSQQNNNTTQQIITPTSQTYVAAPNVQPQNTTCALPQQNSNTTSTFEKLVTAPNVQPENTTCALSQRNSNTTQQVIAPTSEKYVTAPSVQSQNTTCALPQQNSNTTQVNPTTLPNQIQNNACALPERYTAPSTQNNVVTSPNPQSVIQVTNSNNQNTQKNVHQVYPLELGITISNEPPKTCSPNVQGCDLKQDELFKNLTSLGNFNDENKTCGVGYEKKCKFGDYSNNLKAMCNKDPLTGQESCVSKSVTKKLQSPPINVNNNQNLFSACSNNNVQVPSTAQSNAVSCVIPRK